MPEYSLKDTIITSLNAQEPWPHDVKLFQPYEVEQILLPDNASCLAVQAFLKMCNLPFEVEMRWNAEFMSPSGRVPFIKCGAFVVSELEPIVQFAANKGVTLCNKLSGEEKAEMRAYMSLITNVLVNAELYISWLDEETYNSVTKVRNSSVYPWPLGWYQTRAKRASVAKRLRALNWHDKTLDQVLADVEQCCNSLSQRLGEKDFFFGTPTPLDALLSGHVRALLSPPARYTSLRSAIPPTLLAHAVRIAGVTGMAIKPEEENYIKNAINSLNLHNSERMERNARARSRVLRKPIHEDRDRDVFGFKPFFQQIIVMSTKESLSIDEKYIDNTSFVNNIIDQIIDKVDELENHDFEIVYPNRDVNSIGYNGSKSDGIGNFGDGSKFENFERVGDYLETIEENEATDATVSIGEPYYSQRTDEGRHSNTFDTTSGDFTNDNSVPDSEGNGEEMRNNKALSEGFSSNQLAVLSVKDLSIKSETLSFNLSTTESNSTLKLSGNEEISVEKLLKYLRKRNAAYNAHAEIADVD